MDLITRLVRRTLAQMPVAQPLIAPRFAAGPALAAETESDTTPATESEADGSEPPSASLSGDPSAFSPGPAAPPPLSSLITPQQAAAASSEPPGPVERPVAEGEHKPSLLPPALEPEVAAPERPAAAAQRAAPGHAEAAPAPARPDRLVQGPTNPPAPGRTGRVSLRPVQPDGPPAEERQFAAPLVPIAHGWQPAVPPVPITQEQQSSVPLAPTTQERQPGAPLELVAREQRAGSGPEPVRMRQVSKEVVESGGTAHTLVPEQPAPGGPQKATVLLDARPEVSVGSATVRPTLVGRAATAPDAPPQPPTIRVTIGRVEVQAVMPPAPTPVYAPPARREPTLSLKDYLEQRDEGQR